MNRPISIYTVGSQAVLYAGVVTATSCCICKHPNNPGDFRVRVWMSLGSHPLWLQIERIPIVPALLLLKRTKIIQFHGSFWRFESTPQVRCDGDGSAILEDPSLFSFCVTRKEGGIMFSGPKELFLLKCERTDCQLSGLTLEVRHPNADFLLFMSGSALVQALVELRIFESREPGTFLAPRKLESWFPKTFANAS